MTTLAEIRATLKAGYDLIEDVAWDSPAYEDEVVNPTHAKLESLLYGDASLPRDGVILTADLLAWALEAQEGHVSDVLELWIKGKRSAAQAAAAIFAALEVPHD